MTQAEKKIICAKCKVPLETGEIKLSYLDNTFPADILRCPKCKQVYIPEDLVLGRINELEKTLEDK